jgi:hypothetical protein
MIDFNLTKVQLKPEIIGKAIEEIVPLSKIEIAIRESNSAQKRNRILPTPIVILLVISLNFWSTDSVVDVWKNLVQGLMPNLISQKIRLITPKSSSLTEARQRVGAGVMARLFKLICTVRATKHTEGAFLRGLRLMSLDGSLLDVPDTNNNARVFGYPGSRRGTKAAFPKARLVLLIESGTHLIVDALISPYKMGERRKALQLLRSVGPGMLLMWDRGLHSYPMVDSALKQKAHILGRVPRNVKFEIVKVFDDGSYLSWIAPDRKSKKKGATRIKVRVIEYIIQVDGEDVIYRLITDLMDINKFPSLVLAQEYHSRWEIENTLDEFKTHLNGRKTMIRSKNPREVVQEIYGWLLAHYCIRATMFNAATEKGVSPLRISFTGSLKVIRRAVPLCQSNPDPDFDSHYYSWILAEISDLIIPTRQNRSNPRVVKKPRSKFNSAKPKHRGQGTIIQALDYQMCYPKAA